MHSKQELAFTDVIGIGLETAGEIGAALQQDENAYDVLGEKFYKAKDNYFGFFSPFRSITGPTGLGINIAAPIVTPLALGLAAGVAAIGAAVGTLVVAGSLLFAAGAGVVGLINNDAHKKAIGALNFAAISGAVTALCAAASLVSTVVAAVLTPLLFASIFTRSGATVISAVSDCFARNAEASKKHEPELEEPSRFGLNP